MSSQQPSPILPSWQPRALPALWTFDAKHKTVKTPDGRTFELLRGGKKITSDDEIENAIATVATLLTAQNSSIQQEMNKSSIVGEPLHIQFHEDRVEVYRGDTRVAEQLQEAILKADNEYKEKFQTVVTEPQKHVEALILACNSGKHKYSAEAVRMMCDAILAEPNLRIIGEHIETGTERTVGELLSEPGNGPLRRALLDLRDRAIQEPSTFIGTESLQKIGTRILQAVGLKKVGTQETPELKKMKPHDNPLLFYMLPLMKRHPRMVVGLQGDQYVQKMFKGDPSGGLPEPDKAWPSTVDESKKRNEYTQNNINLGSVVSQDGCLLVRSGKPNSSARLRELVRFALDEQLKQPEANRVGLTWNENEKCYQFQLVISSAVDVPHPLIKHERKAFENIVKAVKAWDQNESIEINGQKIKLLRPILTQQPFSGLVRGMRVTEKRVIQEMGMERSANYNFIPNQRLLQVAITQYPFNPDEQEMQQALEYLDMTALQYQNIKPREDYQKKLAYFLLRRMWSAHEAGSLHREEYELYYSLYALNFRRAPPPLAQMYKLQNKDTFINEFRPEPKEEELIHVADMELYRYTLVHHLGLAYSVGCKSGTDRTGYLVALATAWNMFRKANDGRTFMPPHDLESGLTPDNKDLIQFKLFFRQAMNQFGVPTTVETRGIYGVKGGTSYTARIAGGAGGKRASNPAPSKYLILEEDLPYVELEDPTIKTADVTGLTYEKLRQHSRVQYAGEPNKYLYGVSISQVAKEVRAELGKNQTDVKAAAYEANQIFAALGVGEDVIGDDLELARSVDHLHLDETVNYGGNAKTRLQHLQDILAAKKKEKASRFLMYSLENLVKHGQRVQEIEKCNEIYPKPSQVGAALGLKPENYTIVPKTPTLAPLPIHYVVHKEKKEASGRSEATFEERLELIQDPSDRAARACEWLEAITETRAAGEKLDSELEDNEKDLALYLAKSLAQSQDAKLASRVSALVTHPQFLRLTEERGQLQNALLRGEMPLEPSPKLKLAISSIVNRLIAQYELAGAAHNKQLRLELYKKLKMLSFVLERYEKGYMDPGIEDAAIEPYDKKFVEQFRMRGKSLTQDDALRQRDVIDEAIQNFDDKESGNAEAYFESMHTVLVRMQSHVHSPPSFAQFYAFYDGSRQLVALYNKLKPLLDELEAEKRDELASNIDTMMAFWQKVPAAILADVEKSEKAKGLSLEDTRNHIESFAGAIRDKLQAISADLHTPKDVAELTPEESERALMRAAANEPAEKAGYGIEMNKKKIGYLCAALQAFRNFPQGTEFLKKLLFLEVTDKDFREAVKGNNADIIQARFIWRLKEFIDTVENQKRNLSYEEIEAIRADFNLVGCNFRDDQEQDANGAYLDILKCVGWAKVESIKSLPVKLEAGIDLQDTVGANGQLRQNPPVLVHITFDRQPAGQLGKDQTPVTIPPTLTIAGKTYKLITCVVHEGDPKMSGHMTTYSLRDNDAYHFDGEMVQKIPDFMNTRYFFQGFEKLTGKENIETNGTGFFYELE